MKKSCFDNNSSGPDSQKSNNRNITKKKKKKYRRQHHTTAVNPQLIPTLNTLRSCGLLTFRQDKFELEYAHIKATTVIKGMLCNSLGVTRLQGKQICDKMTVISMNSA